MPWPRCNMHRSTHGSKIAAALLVIEYLAHKRVVALSFVFKINREQKNWRSCAAAQPNKPREREREGQSTKCTTRNR